MLIKSGARWLGILWLHFRNITGQSTEIVMLQSTSSRLAVTLCQADYSSRDRQGESCWGIPVAIAWNLQSLDDDEVSVVSCKAAEYHLAKALLNCERPLLRGRVLSHNSKHTDLCEAVSALITTDCQ